MTATLITVDGFGRVKGHYAVEKLASVPPISTSGLCIELCARYHHSGEGVNA
jgi:hypothetical protein